MTIDISNNDPRISYSVASGVTQTTFAVPFEFFDDSDLNVYVDGVLKTITTDYTLTGGDGSTGTVTMTVVGASGGSTVSLTRDTTIERITDFTAGVDINRAALNTQLDTLTAISADVKDLAERAIRVEDVEVAPSLVLPSIADRSGKTLAFNSTTGAIEAGPSIGDVELAGTKASEASASAAAAAASETASALSATNAESAALASGANWYADTTAFLAATSDGAFGYIPEDDGVRVYENVGGVAGAGIWLRDPMAITETLTVGAGGDYATINEALTDVSRRRIIHRTSQVTTTLQLLSGFIMDEQVLVDGVDLGWVELTSADATVTITGSSMDVGTIIVEGATARYAFGADNGGVLPQINALFTVDGTGSASKRHGITLVGGSKAFVGSGCGVTNAPNNGVTLDGASTLLANTSNFSNAGGYGAFLYGGSTMIADYANFSYAGDDCVIATRSSKANISSANCSFAGVNGVLATQGSIVVAGEVNVNDCASSGLRARGASTINANSCTGLRCSTGVYADRGCRISITDDSGSADFTGCTSNALAAYNGGEIIGENVQCGAARILAQDGGRIIVPGVTVATTAASFHGITCNGGSFVNAEDGAISVSGASAKAISCVGGEVWANNSTLTATQSVTISANDGGIVRAHGSTINVSTTAACYATAAHIYVMECTFNAVDDLIFDTLHGGTIDAASATINWSGTAPGTAFRVKDGALINVSGTTEGANVTVNTLTSSGFVIQ